ncbi:hypothetical protein NLI96_g10310 [Meripilus lineatus]|uniref:Uncharacterized protein n=1 Tax=Meripilus lineatus TaxID=2056292 RepID=A0AAD5UYH3_9APHY|nr:hypothetical protein NLI96_g10310 [Physisporinus lineatus]
MTTEVRSANQRIDQDVRIGTRDDPDSSTFRRGHERRYHDINLAIQSQCVLNMAMRLHKLVPGIIDESLFEALHTTSVNMFDLEAEGWFRDYIQKEPEQMVQISAQSVGELDWKKLLKGGEYVEVEVRGEGEYTEYGDKWEYQKLRMSCKLRIEFFLNRGFVIPDPELYRF